MGDHQHWRSHFNGEVFNMLWFYWYTWHPFIVAPTDCYWFAWQTFPSIHVYLHGEVQATEFCSCCFGSIVFNESLVGQINSFIPKLYTVKLHLSTCRLVLIYNMVKGFTNTKVAGTSPTIKRSHTTVPMDTDTVVNNSVTRIILRDIILGLVMIMD